MDLRKPVLALLVGGSPAPGVNGVISSVTLEARNMNLDVIGIYEGWSHLREGVSKVEPLRNKMVTRIHREGGSILRTSVKQLTTDEHLDNVLRVLAYHRVQYLVTIGGVNTMLSAGRLAKVAPARLSIVHIPKTIFNDLPLPGDGHTFGFATARQVGFEIMENLMQDARSIQGFYVVNVLGSRAGHLALGIGKSSAATLTLIPEDFEEGVPFSKVVDQIEATLYKRLALKKNYGCILLGEGIVDRLRPAEVKSLFGSVSAGHDGLSIAVKKELSKRIPTLNVMARNLGNELRAAAPISDDVILTRDLGFGAVHFLVEGGNGAMLTCTESGISPIPLHEVVDVNSHKASVRLVDRQKATYRVARQFMIRLNTNDLNDPFFFRKLCEASNLEAKEFKAKFSCFATGDKWFHPQINPSWDPADVDADDSGESARRSKGVEIFNVVQRVRLLEEPIGPLES